MEMFHWAWQRQRLPHHVGATRSYSRDEDVLELRGPHVTSSGPCDLCTAALSHQSASDLDDDSALSDIDDGSWLMSSSSDDDDEILTAVLSRGQICIRAARSNRKKLDTGGECCELIIDCCSC
jgi:hypothetical protein